MKECPRCSLISPDNTIRCDCGYNFESIAFNDLSSNSAESFNKNENYRIEVPIKIIKWNWSAFLLNWIWGLGNNVYISLLTFIPFIGFLMPFILGFNGIPEKYKDLTSHHKEDIEKYHLIDMNGSNKNVIFYGILVLLI